MYQPRVKGRSARHDLRGVGYHVTEWGHPSDRLLVFLHGWGDAGSTFQFVVDELRGSWFVIAPDWRGFGRSGTHASAYWFPDYLADLHAILEIYSLDRPAVIAGHSMGANAATLYAGVMPERVAALINIEGFGLPDSDPADAPRRYREWILAGRSPPACKRYDSLDGLVPAILRRSPGLSSERALFVAEQWAVTAADGGVRTRADPAHKLPNAVLYRRPEAVACWRAVTAPVLLVIGADTDFSSAADLEQPDVLKGHFANAVLCEIAGAGHMVHFDQPALLAEAVEAFLADL